VLDPDMQDEVKVTVVATGLNRAVSRQAVRSNEREDSFGAIRRPQVQLVNTQGRRDGTTGMMIDDTESFSPGAGIAAHLRGRGHGHAEAAAPTAADFGSDSSYLDIPAFLRRQAD
jgi:cell division protein FtsZ